MDRTKRRLAALVAALVLHAPSSAFSDAPARVDAEGASLSARASFDAFAADWMARNLDRRVEVVAPVLDPQAKQYLKDMVLAAYLRDNVKARNMNSDGTYVHPPMGIGEEDFNSQLFFEGPNSSPPVGSVHPLKRKRLWTKPQA